MLVRQGTGIEDAVKEIYPLMTGAFSIPDHAIARETRYFIRDIAAACARSRWQSWMAAGSSPPKPARSIRSARNWCARSSREKWSSWTNRVLRGICLVEPDPKFDLFEFVYFARPDSMLLGQSVYQVRQRSGVELAKEAPLDVDVVIPVPETGIPAAIGYSRALGLPFEMGLAKNRYIHRTFIQPEQHMREQGVKVKLTPIEGAIAGKRVAVLDDSIVRGTTSREMRPPCSSRRVPGKCIFSFPRRRSCTRIFMVSIRRSKNISSPRQSPLHRSGNSSARPRSTTFHWKVLSAPSQCPKSAYAPRVLLGATR